MIRLRRAIAVAFVVGSGCAVLPVTSAHARAVGAPCATRVGYESPIGGGSRTAGIRFAAVEDEWSAVTPLAGMMAHSVAAADANGDGWIDVFVGSFADRPLDDYRVRGATGPSPDRLLLGGPNGFTPAPDFPTMRGRTSGAAFADLDGDGKLDLVIARNVRQGTRADTPTEILRNLGRGRFERAATIEEPAGARSIGVLDYDRDGRSDLFVVEDRWAGGSSVLLRNQGAFAFEDVTRSAGLPNGISGLGISTADLDGDGHGDLFVSGSNRVFYSDESSRFREGDAGQFKTPTFGPEDDPGGVAAGDLDGDGRIDLVIGQHYGSTIDFGKRVPIGVYLNRVSGRDSEPSFERVPLSAGLDGLPTRAPHVEIADFDNDARPDVLVGVTVDGATTPLVYRNLGVGGDGLRFEANGKVTSETYWAGGAVGDLDRDGRLDAVLVDFDPSRPSVVARNTSHVAHWAAIEAPAGSTVELTSGTGRRALSPVGSSSGFSSAGPPIAWFGVDDARANRAKVVLPDGRVMRLTVGRDELIQLDC